jgi:HNH endonuclease
MRKGDFREKNPNWKGGRLIASNGYVLIRLPNHPLADVRGYVYEHRVVAEKKIGRSLLPSEQVHHRDENKQNNDPSNLEVVQDGHHHRALHRKAGRQLQGCDEPNRDVVCACGCGVTFKKYDSSGRPRSYLPGHNGRINPIEDNTVVECACGCGKQFNKYSEDGKLRTYAFGHSSKTYRFKRENPLIACACGCGAQFHKYDTKGRARKFVSGHNAMRSRNVR